MELARRAPNADTASVDFKQNTKQFLGFTCVGMTAFVFEYLLFLFLTIPCQLHYILAHSLARVLSAILHFLLNRNLVFRSSKGLLAESAKYTAAALFVLAATAGLLYLFVEHMKMSPLLAKPLAGLVMFIFSFVTLKTVVFANERSKIASVGQ
jgi:putative flippase GtrA